MNAKLISAALIALSASVSCADTGEKAFWDVSEGRFHKGADAGPIYFLGTNMWYGPLLASDTEAGDMDRLLSELGKRDMTAVLYLNNSWEWPGGYGQYLEWAGDDYCGDPAQEQQGLNSVYLADSTTISLIRNTIRTPDNEHFNK